MESTSARGRNRSTAPAGVWRTRPNAIRIALMLASVMIVTPTPAAAAAPIPTAVDDVITLTAAYVVPGAAPAVQHFPIADLLANDLDAGQIDNPVTFRVWSDTPVGDIVDAPCPTCSPYGAWLGYRQVNPDARTDTFNYAIVDADGDYSIGTVVIVIDHFPIGYEDGTPLFVYSSAGGPVTIDVLRNDTGLIDRPIALTLDGGSGGLAVDIGCAPDYLLTLTPNQETFGGLHVRYKATDAEGDEASAAAYVFYLPPDSSQGPNDGPRHGCTLDFDGDGVPDGGELGRPTDPNVSDSDRDGLGDGAEAILGTDPQDADTDRDCVSDALDAAPAAGLPVLDCSAPPADEDTDGDGALDSWEEFYGTDPLDGLDNLQGVSRANGSGHAGITCGTSAFTWHSAVGDQWGGSAGSRGCILLISNRTANALVDAVLAGEVATMSEGVVELAGAAAGDQLPTPTELFLTIEAQFAEFGVRRAVLKSLGIAKFNAIFTAGEVVALAGLPILAGLLLSEIRDHNACLQITILENGLRADVGWNLVFAGGRTSDRNDQVGGVHQRIVRKFRPDSYELRPTNLSCGADGFVYGAGRPGKPFNTSQPFTTSVTP